MLALAPTDGWARRLRWFRFVHAVGGHANDGDQLSLVLRYADPDDLRGLLRELGVETPGWNTVAGARVFVYVAGGLELVMNDTADPYSVTANTVVEAERVEQMIEAHPALWSRVVDPPVDHPRCICPKYHPRVFEGLPPRGAAPV